MSFDAHRLDLVIGIVGTGAMGRGIVQIAAQAGIATRLYDAKPGAALEARVAVGEMLAKLAAKGKLSEDQVARAMASMVVADHLPGLSDCHLVVEAIVEKLDVKQALFRDLESLVAPETILATNTSSLSVAAIAQACQRPERVAGWHFFNPVPLMKIVEVIGAQRTAPWVTEGLTELAKRVGHQAVSTADMPGFLVNHAGRAYGPEALRLVAEGVSDFATIDRILRDGAGFRQGPFELYDMTGLDVSQAVMESIYEQFYHEPRYRPTALGRARVQAGLFGRKNGQGFYRYEGGQKQEPPEPPVPTPSQLPPIWVMPGPDRELVAGMALAGGAPIDDGAQPGPQSLCLVTPLGHDTTTACQMLKLDGRRTVALDTLMGLERRRTIMATPITEPAYRNAAHAVLAASGVPVSVIHDCPGFVIPRIVANIVNVACDIAQQRIAKPDDIDRAVMLGLGYPKGPLAWGDAIGPMRVLAILAALFSFYADPRFRPSPWLIRRARLGVSLLTPEG